MKKNISRRLVQKSEFYPMGDFVTFIFDGKEVLQIYTSHLPYCCGSRIFSRISDCGDRIEIPMADFNRRLSAFMEA